MLCSEEGLLNISLVLTSSSFLELEFSYIFSVNSVLVLSFPSPLFSLDPRKHTLELTSVSVVSLPHFALLISHPKHSETELYKKIPLMFAFAHTINRGSWCLL